MRTAISFWTLEKVEQLKYLFGTGLSASKIANETGAKSRNAVIGKAHRLGLSLPNLKDKPKRDPRRRVRVARPGVKRVPGGSVPKVSGTGIPTKFRDNGSRPPAELPPPEDIDDLAIPAEQRCTIYTLNKVTCRWPVGEPGTPDLFFCGAPECDNEHPHHPQPYCRAHTRRAGHKLPRLTQPILDERRAYHEWHRKREAELAASIAANFDQAKLNRRLYGDDNDETEEDAERSEPKPRQEAIKKGNRRACTVA